VPATYSFFRSHADHAAHGARWERDSCSAAAPRGDDRSLPREEVRPGREQGQGGMRVLVSALAIFQLLAPLRPLHPGHRVFHRVAAGRFRGRALPAAAVFLLARRVLGLALTPSMIAECGHLFNSGNRASLFGEGIGNQPPWRPAEGRYIGGGGGWLRTSRPPTSRPDPVCRPFVRPGGTKNEHLQ